MFLVDGTPQGMRTAEVGNWTGLALMCPRTDLTGLAGRPEVKKTGVYILVGPSETDPSSISVRLGNLNAIGHLRARPAAVDPAHNVMRRFSPRKSR